MQTHINIKLFVAPYESHAYIYIYVHICVYVYMYTKCTYMNNTLLSSKGY